LRVSGAILADNLIGATFAAYDAFLEDSLAVGESANKGTPYEEETAGLDGRSLPAPWDPAYPIRGFEFYDGIVGARDVVFAGFFPNEQRGASGLGFLRQDEFALDPRNGTEAITWLDDSNRFLLDSPRLPYDGEKTAIFRDTDGSVTGKPGAVIAANQPFLTSGGCVLQLDWNAFVCDGAFGGLAIQSFDDQPAFMGPVVLERPDGEQVVLVGAPDEEYQPRSYFQASLVANQPYDMELLSVPARLRLTYLGRSTESEWVTLRLPYQSGDPHVYAGYDVETAIDRLDAESDLSALADAGWIYDGEYLVVKLYLPAGQEEITLDICLNEGCA
jgi:hypothetical protein